MPKLSADSSDFKRWLREFTLEDPVSLTDTVDEIGVDCGIGRGSVIIYSGDPPTSPDDDVDNGRVCAVIDIDDSMFESDLYLSKFKYLDELTGIALERAVSKMSESDQEWWATGIPPT